MFIVTTVDTVAKAESEMASGSMFPSSSDSGAMTGRRPAVKAEKKIVSSSRGDIRIRSPGDSRKRNAIRASGPLSPRTLFGALSVRGIVYGGSALGSQHGEMEPLRVGVLEEDEVFLRGLVAVLTDEGSLCMVVGSEGALSPRGANEAGRSRSAGELVSVRTAVDGLECREVRYARPQWP
jgi:hypothetical protein